MMMKAISLEGKLSQIYCNHCLWATINTVLGNAGVESKNICIMMGHRNYKSLQSYIKEPYVQQQKEMCNTIHEYGKQNIEQKILMTQA